MRHKLRDEWSKSPTRLAGKKYLEDAERLRLEEEDRAGKVYPDAEWTRNRIGWRAGCLTHESVRRTIPGKKRETHNVVEAQPLTRSCTRTLRHRRRWRARQPNPDQHRRSPRALGAGHQSAARRRH